LGARHELESGQSNTMMAAFLVAMGGI